MFSSLPKLADKTFIVAFLIPTLAFLLALGAAFPGFLTYSVPPEHGDSAKALVDATTTLVDATLTAAGLWFCALGLMLVNRPLYRLLEGYFGPLAARTRVDRLKQTWRDGQDELSARLAKARALPAGSLRDEAARAYNQLRLRLGRRFPSNQARVLGSRFGNVNRAFEDYPEAAYGAFAVATWPRLNAVIPASFQSVLSDARAQVDCFVNVIFLALAFAAIEVVHGLLPGAAVVAADWPRAKVDLFRAIWEGVSDLNGLALLAAVVAVFVARLAYELALNRAEALGDQVRAAFDLYLGGLAKQLGYDLPQAEADRRELWKLLRRTWSYGDPTPELFRSKRPPDPPVTNSEAKAVAGAEQTADA